MCTNINRRIFNVKCLKYIIKSIGVQFSGLYPVWSIIKLLSDVIQILPAIYRM